MNYRFSIFHCLVALGTHIGRGSFILYSCGMNQFLEDVYSGKPLYTKTGLPIRFHSHTSKDQCLFLQKIIADNKFSRSVEIGLAFGMSAIAIAEVIIENGGQHTVIDKFQVSDWGSNGLQLIEQAGYKDAVEFHEDYSHVALPAFLSEGRTFDFAYIDSTKLFDYLLVDFFFIDKMLTEGGIIVFDDAAFPGIRKLLRYLSQLPHYKVYDSFKKNLPNSYDGTIAGILRKLPKAEKYLSPKILQSDYSMGIGTYCVALQKLGEDSRKYDWHKDF